MGIRSLLQEGVTTSDPSAVTDFWRDFVPQPPAPLPADAQAGFIIGFVLLFFIVCCVITKIWNMAHQIEDLQNRMELAENFVAAEKAKAEKD